VVAGCGHAVALEQPGALAALVRSRTRDLVGIDGERVLATEG
jgi:pimeloyl-ACP methyl ester carboxylesterase